MAKILLNLWPFGIIAIVIGIIYLFYSPFPPAQKASTLTSEQASTTPSTEPEAPTIDFSDPSMLTQARAIPKTPQAIHIRKVLNAYLQGTSMDDSVLTLTPADYTQMDMVGGFASFDKSLYKSRFIVITVNPDIAGGEEYDLLFLDHPDHIYTAWLYQLGATNTYEFREFWRNDDYPSNFGTDFIQLNPRVAQDATLSS
jgi:hypothetical protein